MAKLKKDKDAPDYVGKIAVLSSSIEIATGDLLDLFKRREKLIMEYWGLKDDTVIRDDGKPKMWLFRGLRNIGADKKVLSLEARPWIVIQARGDRLPPNQMTNKWEIVPEKEIPDDFRTPPDGGTEAKTAGHRGPGGGRAARDGGKPSRVAGKRKHA
jgi:hypothetical protein